jgi:hypothetical protein
MRGDIMLTTEQEHVINDWRDNPNVHRLDVIPNVDLVESVTCHIFALVPQGNKRTHATDYELIAVGTVDPFGDWEMHVPSPVEMSTIQPIMEEV